MKTLLTLFLLVVHYFNSPLLLSQTTEDYFSRPGLSINAFTVDLFGDTSSTSYSFSHKTIICGDTALVMAHNLGGSTIYLVIEDKKVYKTDFSCTRYLILDFGLEIGEIMHGEPCDGCIVVAKHDTLLLNGEQRLFMELEKNGYHFYWIEGIGDVRTGFIPSGQNNIFRFVCARDSTGNLWINENQVAYCDTFSCRRPRAQFLLEPDELSISLLNSSKFANQYVWDFGDGHSTSAFHSDHTYSDPGCYTVKLTVANDCYKDSITIGEAVSICSGFNWDTIATIDFLEYFNLVSVSDTLHFLYNYSPTVNDKLFRSTDGARTWQQIFLPPLELNQKRTISGLKMFDEKRGLLVTYFSNEEDHSAVFTTDDAGMTWSGKGLGEVYIGDIELGNNGIAYIFGSSHYVHKTEDYGHTWIDLTPYIQRPEDMWNFGDTVLFARLRSNPENTLSIAKSNDGGFTWHNIMVPDYIKYLIYLSPQNVIGFDATKPGIYKSYDGGYNWTLLLPDTRLMGLEMFDENKGWLADFEGVLYYSTDAFETLQKIKCGPKHIFGLYPQNSNKILITDLEYLMSFKGPIGFPCLDNDNDGDGYYGGSDCDDNNFDINPGGIEIPDNGIDEDCDSLDLITAIREIGGIEIIIYPNPASETIHVESADQESFTLAIYNLHGSLLQMQAATNYLDISNLVPGMYILEIRNKDLMKVVEKFIKK